MTLLLLLLLLAADQLRVCVRSSARVLCFLAAVLREGGEVGVGLVCSWSKRSVG